MRIFYILLLLHVHSVFGQSWIGLKYSGGIPTNRLFGNTPEYMNGFEAERYSVNVFGKDEEQHDLRFGCQMEIMEGLGIQKNEIFPTLSNNEQSLNLQRSIFGLSVNSRYTNIQKFYQPYVDFAVGWRTFDTHLKVPELSGNGAFQTFKETASYTNYCIGSGITIPILETVKLDFGIKYNLGMKDNLYDFSSVYASGANLKASEVKSSTSTLQFEIGLIINYRRPANSSFLGDVLKLIL